MDDAQILKVLIQREEQLMDNVVRGNAEMLARLMDDKSVDVSEGGQRRVYRAGDTLSASEGVVYITTDSTTLSDLSQDCKHLAYVSARVIDDKQFRCLNSSIWKRQGDVWKRVFHQGTVCAKETKTVV